MRTWLGTAPTAPVTLSRRKCELLLRAANLPNLFDRLRILQRRQIARLFAIARWSVNYHVETPTRYALISRLSS